MLKYLRIAVTALSLTACALLIALWISSHYKYFTVWCTVTRSAGIVVQSLYGKIQFRCEETKYEFKPPFIGVRIVSVDGWYDNTDSNHWHWGGFGASWKRTDELYPELRHSLVVFPYWFLVMVTAMNCGGIFVDDRWRFSLRTLLIATTLIAVVMAGIVVVAS